MQKLLKIALAVLLILGGITHLINPEFYFGFVPEFLPKTTVVYISGIIELVLGIELFSKRFREKASLGILILMCLFLPIHVWDYFKENPAIGSHTAAIIRIFVQFMFIFWAYKVYQKSK
ncbi:hypothetical protein [Aureivirga sp. CE67]|uniref:hypothetical protein n=1 Tax=Aureivirga sp. CE67 TaxID=1788983 RepID=UPI0018C905F2|nr:hypothetical protein [Aureivirga sp. CE67]